MAHSDLSDAGRVTHFEIDGWLPTPDEKAALAGEPIPPSDANRYLTQNHPAGGFSGFANPTASVGLAAVNGVATTAMRSDGAPALDQGIIPTWTALHTYGAGLAVSAGQGIAMADETCWFGIGAALERINVNAAGYVSVMGADFAVGTLAPDEKVHIEGNILVDAYNDLGEGGGIFFREGFASGDASPYNLSITLRGWGTPVSPDGFLISGYDGIGFMTESNTYDATKVRMLITMAGDIGFGTILPDRLTHAEAGTAETVAIAYANRLSHTTSGAAAPLFGVGQEHELEDAGGAMQVVSEVVTLWATATAGAESPLYRGTTYPIGAAGPGYWGFWTWNNLDDNARTIVPNGAGDVASGVTIVYRLSESGGGSEGNVVMVANGGAVDLYDDGTDVFTLTVNADGSVTVVRSAGATTADLSLLMCWL